MTDSYFIFNGYEPAWDSGKASFFYKMERGGEIWNFTDTIEFPPPEGKFDVKLAEAVLDSLSLIFGISYWKLFCPSDIRLPYHVLSEEQAEFWNIVYSIGLGEFYYENKIDFRGKIRFPFSSGKIPDSLKFESGDRSLLLVGGGKDSIVSGELLKKYGKKFSAFLVNPRQIQLSAARILGSDKIEMKHELDSRLFELNKRADIYNGHVPVSIMYAFAAVLAAALHGYRYVIASNESSADSGNLEYLGMNVNHQWDKSSEAERLIANYVHLNISPDISYFSLLRPWSEIKIAGKFSRYEKYFPFFSSCNLNFRIKEQAKKKWCGECPKCAFVFAILSAFVGRKELTDIFGENLFAKENLIPLFEELLGMKNHKPFECVGTQEETRLAFYLAHQKREYDNDPAMIMFVKHFTDKFDAIKAYPFMTFSGEHFLPPSFEEIVKNEN